MSIARHTTYNVLGSIAPILVTLITVPIYVHAIGIERYGVLSLCWLLAGYFTFLDFGIGRATAQRMAKSLRSPSSERNALFWTSATIAAVFAALGFAVAVGTIDAFLPRLVVTPSLRPEVEVSLIPLALSVPLGILQSLFAGTLEGRRSFGAVNIVLSTGSVLTAALPLVAALLVGPHLLNVIWATLIARLITVLLLLVCCWKEVPIGTPSLMMTAEWRSLIQFGGWASITAIAGPFLVYFDRFAIGALLGGAAVAYYVIGFNIIMQMLLVPTAFSRALFPHLASIEASESSRQGAQATRVLLVVAMLMTVVAMALISPFLRAWLGTDIAAKTAPVTIILLIGFWANSAAQSAFTHLQSKGRADLPAKAHLIELLPYFALFYFLTSSFGIAGAALAWTARAVSDFIILQVMDGLDQSLRRLIASTVAFVIAATAVQFVFGDSWLRLGAGLVVVTAASIVAAKVAPPIATKKLRTLFAQMRPARDLQ